MEVKEGYLNSEAAKILGVDSNQIMHWTVQGLLVPSVEARGAGTKRRYDQLNLLELAIIKDLLFVHGEGIQTVKRILQLAREESLLKDWLSNSAAFFAKQFESGIFGYSSKSWKLSQYGTPEWARMRDSLQTIFVDEPKREIEEGGPPRGIFIYFPRGGDSDSARSLLARADALTDEQGAAGLRIAAMANISSSTGTALILPKITTRLREELLYGAAFLYSQLSSVGSGIFVDLQSLLIDIGIGVKSI